MLAITTKDQIICPDIIHWPLYNRNIYGDMRKKINHYITALLNNKPYLVSTENAISTIDVVEGCLKSMETGNPVIFSK